MRISRKSQFLHFVDFFVKVKWYWESPLSFHEKNWLAKKKDHSSNNRKLVINQVPGPNCHPLRWCLLALLSQFCWCHRRWFCDVEANTFRHLHLWITKAKTHYCYRWIPKANCYGVTSNPKEQKNRKWTSQLVMKVIFNLLEIEFAHNFHIPKHICKISKSLLRFFGVVCFSAKRNEN